MSAKFVKMHLHHRQNYNGMRGGRQNILNTNVTRAEGNMSHDMRFPTMWYVRPAKPQISLRIHAV